MKTLAEVHDIQQRICFVRGLKGMLDKDLALLYGVKPTRLREQVKRNKDRFPLDFMFQLTRKEAEILVSQNAIPSLRHLGGSLPYMFTQEGIAMLSGILRSPRAVQANIAIMRAFVRLRQMIAGHRELAKRIAALERRLDGTDEDIRQILDIIQDIMKPKKIGFQG